MNYMMKELYTAPTAELYEISAADAITTSLAFNDEGTGDLVNW